MRTPLRFGLLLSALAGLSIPASAHAAQAQCVSPEGDCTVSNVPEDNLTCNCANGLGGGFFGGNQWAGLNDADLQPICDAELAAFCGGQPVPGLECMGATGTCTISNNPFDWVECECDDGSGFGGGGGNDWAGLNDGDLLAICEGFADNCAAGPPPPPGVQCGNADGFCEVDNNPDSLFCECNDGSGFGFEGGNNWDGLNDGDLLMICEDELVMFCSGPVGTTGGSDDDGDTEGSGDTDDSGPVSSTSGPSSTSDSGSGTVGDLTTGGPSLTTGGQLDTGDGGSDGVGTSGGGHSSTSLGPDPTTAGSDGAVSSGGGSDGGGGCSTGPRPGPGGWGLMLLGLAGLGWRRRRQSV